MEHVPISTLVVITLLQLCRAQFSDSDTPEWVRANDSNETADSPISIGQFLALDPSYSPLTPGVMSSQTPSMMSSQTPSMMSSQTPSIVSSQTPSTVTTQSPCITSSQTPSTVSSPCSANRGIELSPTPMMPDSESTENTPPPNVIPLSSTELPPSPPSSQPPSPTQTLPSFQTEPFDIQRPSFWTTPQEFPSTETNSIPKTAQNLTLPNSSPAPVLRNNIVQNVRSNQPPLISSRIPQQQTLPKNVQFMFPTPTGNRIFQGRQLSTNGQENVFVLYEQPPQNIRNFSPDTLSMLPQQPQLPMPFRGSQQQVTRTPNTVARQPLQVANQSQSGRNSFPPANNIIMSYQPIQPLANQLQNQLNQAPSDQLQNNNPVSNRASVNEIQSVPRALAPLNLGPRGRPLRQNNRVNSSRLNNRGGPRVQTPNNVPCQGANNTAPSSAVKAHNPIITIRLKPTTMARNSLHINRTEHTNTSTILRPRPSSQLNNKNYERCLNSCRDKKDRICAAPPRDVQINPDTLKGFPSMCHMACHNTFKANPIYEKIANGRCGKLRTRIQTVDKSKIKRDELKKSQYTIISNIPGTVVELEP